MYTLSKLDFAPQRLVGDEPAAFRIAIVGMGARGLGVLEQLTELARELPGLRLHIDVYDPNAPGAGLHAAEQPDYLMLNTMAGQLTAYSAARPAGPTFLQWCEAWRIGLDLRGHVAASGGRPVTYGDFVPRKLLGRYLQDAYRLLVRQCPAHVRVRHHAEAVVQCRPRAGRAGFRLVTASGWQQGCDALFLTAGHAPQPQAPQASGARVAIEGLGLTALDALAHLTEGRGGRFVPDRGFARWRYQASGREPQIFMYSRSGLPFHSRPRWHADAPHALPRLFFTAQTIAVLRAERHPQRLDFRRDVLPLIEAEMSAVFYQSRVVQGAPAQLACVQQQLRQAIDPAQRQALFASLAQQWGSFEPADWLAVDPWSEQGEPYALWLRRWVERDLALSRLGTACSAVARALEVWRDYRDVLRLVAARNGLSEASTHEFYSLWAGLSNRLVGGPQHERYQDLLALIDAGVVTLLAPGAASAYSFDTVIRARVAHGGLSGRPSGLFADLLEQGLIRAAHPYPADGIETDELGRVVGRDGCVHPRLWALGPAVEGCTFYNHYVPTPDPDCLAPIEAHAAARSCLDSLIDATACCA